MEEQVIKSLIELYREQGIDVTAVVGDPIFEKLPLNIRIELVKKYANEISRDSRTELNRQDIKQILRETATGASLGAVGGAIGAYRVGHFFENINKNSLRNPIAKTALIGGALGLATSSLRTISSLNSRRNLHSRALELAANPTDNNAIKLMAIRNMQPPVINRTNILNRIYNLTEDRQFSETLNSPARAGHEVFENNLPNNVVYKDDAENATKLREDFKHKYENLTKKY